MKTLPTLYKQATSGKIQKWEVSVEGNIVTSTFGQVGGKLQSTSDTISGKNQGKSNSTSDEEQALLKAQQLWDKKKKQGYTEDFKQAKSTSNVLEAVKPMLAFPIEDKTKYVKFPCYVQPKLDGMRCIAVVKGGKCTLYTRTQKEIVTVPHINRQVESLCCGYDVILDGELYNHELKDNFNQLMSLIKRDKPHPSCASVQYHLYDRVSGQKYKERFDFISFSLALNKGSFTHLRPITTVTASTREEMMEHYEKFKSEGYEGAMYRAMHGGYEHKRSPTLLKIKEMQDAEYEIVGVIEGNGKLQGHAGSFVCRLPDGNTFAAKLKGQLSDLKTYFDNFDKYLGRKLTVQFQDYTPAGVPRFPIGLRIREEE